MREQALATIADVVCTLDLAHPRRVAIDGRTASGKMTVADELATTIRAYGRSLIVDGTFLQRPELRDAWDLVALVDVPEEIAALRGCTRDAERLGGMSDASSLYGERYLPAYRIYEAQCNPVSGAHILLDNRDFAAASVHVQRLP